MEEHKQRMLMQKKQAGAKHTSTVAVIKSRKSKEQARELANINKEQDVGRAHLAEAILGKAMQKWDMSIKEPKPAILVQ